MQNAPRHQNPSVSTLNSVCMEFSNNSEVELNDLNSIWNFFCHIFPDVRRKDSKAEELGTLLFGIPYEMTVQCDSCELVFVSREYRDTIPYYNSRNNTLQDSLDSMFEDSSAAFCSVCRESIQTLSESSSPKHCRFGVVLLEIPLRLKMRLVSFCIKSEKKSNV